MAKQYSLHKCCDGHELWEIVVTPSGKNLHELPDVVDELNRLVAEVERLRDECDRQYDQNTEQIVRISVLEAEVERLSRTCDDCWGEIFSVGDEIDVND